MKPVKKCTVTALVLTLLMSAAGCAGTSVQNNAPDKDEKVLTVTEASTEQAEAAIVESPEETLPDEAEKSPAEEESSSDTTDEPAADEEEKIVIPDDVMTIERDIPDTEGFELVKRMRAGWNLGNTFDAYDDTKASGDNLQIETYWQPDRTTPELIMAIHEAGFETIRIPVSWHNHFIDDDYTISEAWLDRVEEVVNEALGEGMYVIIDIHHDNELSVNCLYPDAEHREQSLRFVERVWSQVGERFKGCNERLIFESMNEPRLVGTTAEWDYQDSDERCKEAMAIINELNQCFVDTVRAQGGENATRWLTCPSYAASVNAATSKLFVLPTDPAGRVMVSTHAYTPYDFALNLSGTDKFNYKNKGNTNELEAAITKLYVTFVKKGIPVIMDEFGALNKNDNLQARVDFTAFYVATARASGITCCLWDNNSYVGTGENFGIIRRGSQEWEYPEIAEAIARYSAAE